MDFDLWKTMTKSFQISNYIVDCLVEICIFRVELGYLVDAVQNRRMVLSAELPPDLWKACLCQRLTQVHRDLARDRNLSGVVLLLKIGNLEAVVNGDSLLNEINGNAAGFLGKNCSKDVVRQIQINRQALERCISS